MTEEIAQPETKPKKTKKLKSKALGRPRDTVKNRKDRNRKVYRGRMSSDKYGDTKKVVKQNKKPGPARFVLPFEQARDIIHSENLGSRNDFIRWWNMNIPARIPKNPARTYLNEGWVSWGDWLGTYNTYPDPKQVYRSFHDAQNYARSLRLRTKEEWLQLARSGKIPADIPMWPNLAYGKTILTAKPKRGGHWVSWKDWLGSSLGEQLVAVKNKLNVLVVGKVDGMPSNVYSFVTLSEFEQDLKRKLKEASFHPIKIYHVNRDFDWGGLLDSKYTMYYDTPGLYTISNINETLYYFDMNMERMVFSA